MLEGGKLGIICLFQICLIYFNKFLNIWPGTFCTFIESWIVSKKQSKKAASREKTQRVWRNIKEQQGKIEKKMDQGEATLLGKYRNYSSAET